MTDSGVYDWPIFGTKVSEKAFRIAYYVYL